MSIWTTLAPVWATTPLLPWAAACLLAVGVEWWSGSSTRWPDRQLNIKAGILALLAIAITQALLISVYVWIRHLTHTTQAPIALDQGYPGASVLGVLAFVAIYDVGYYIFHRLQHALPWLWKFHAIHHSDPAMNATTYMRQHVLETVFQSFFLLLPILFIFHLQPSTAIISGLAVGTLQFLIHADVPVHYGRLSVLLVSPLQHRWHHARSEGAGTVNFAGVFPLIDVLGRTYKSPRSGKRVETGLFDGTTWITASGFLLAKSSTRQALPLSDQ